MKLIDADKVIAKVDLSYLTLSLLIGQEESRIAVAEIKRLIRETPTVDAEPIKHGHWIGIDDEPWETYECDKCGYITEDIECSYGIPNNFKYCPSCGALMEEIEE